MRKWFYDNPWIWIVFLLGALVAGSLVVLVIAQLNRPIVVKEEKVAVLNPAALSTDHERPAYNRMDQCNPCVRSLCSPMSLPRAKNVHRGGTGFAVRLVLPS